MGIPNKMPYKTYQPRGGSRSSRTPLPATTPAVQETPEVAQPLKEEKDVDMNEENGQKKSFFARIKEGGVKKKVPKAVQKKRNNYRLRRLVAPKAPLTVLNELIGTTEPVTYTFLDVEGVAPNMPQHMFTAMATVHGEKYQGIGPSKAIAKNICAEQVIQAIVAKKCAEKREMMDTGDENEKPKNEDETPWASLASLALFKLFNDWQAQGYVLPPDLNKAAPPVATKPEGIKKEEKRPAKIKEIPENPTSKHPVQLLNEMNGPIEFELTGEAGEMPQAKVFTMSCTVQDKTYSGNGKSKKDAKKMAALAVLEDLYKITYPAPQV